MATRVVEGKKPYTGGKAISIDENKVISLNLRDENNLIIYDEGDDEIYVDLQLDDEITPTSAFPIGVNVGRVIVDNGWDKAGTIISAETTSGDNIKIFYADEGTLRIDNGTGTFKQIYFKADVDALLLALRNYIDGELAKKQNGVSSAIAPSNPGEGDLWYDTTSSAMKVWDGTTWQSVGTGGGGSEIVYATQAEYNALPSSKLTDDKHYFIYSTSGGGGWQPGANTIAYYPLDSTNTVNDLSGNNKNLTNNNSVIFGTTGGVDCATFSGSNYLNIAESLFTGSPDFTVNLWYRKTENDANNHHIFGIGQPNGNQSFLIWKKSDGNLYIGGWNNDRDTLYSIPQNTWLNLVYAHSGGTIKVYVNGSLQYTGTVSYGVTNRYTGVGCSMMNSDPMIGNLSKVIVENKQWTATDISDYFDATKGDYGII